ncbi:hypothetical protein [Prolixibacter sp. SD074]|uniref:hypothetical protein n=1 Tax=Prolixibacter sp. SD074 TaxID=2652391 RepID=UPI0012818E6A|nr:hypothetical protein [Prolixibacter sp. SD074]GET28187.1 hypothetical protein SD074_03890 [Prolixibacter sp. SD074]
MEVIYIIIGIVIFGIIFSQYQKNKRSQSPYFKTKKRLETEFDNAVKTDDWQERQKVNLELIWLKTIKDIESRDMFSNNLDDSKIRLKLSQLSENEIKLPEKWKLDDLYHFPFVGNILAGMGDLLVNSEYQLYKPNSVLPFPKDIITKAIYYMFDYFNYDKPLYEIPEEQKKKQSESLNTIKFILIENIVDTNNTELPKQGIENFRVGNKLSKGHEYKEENELQLIDWRNEVDWIKWTVQYADNNNFDFALKCIEVAKLGNPNSDNLKEVERMLYLHMSEYYEEKDNKDLTKKYLKMAVELGNEEAIAIYKKKYSE